MNFQKKTQQISSASQEANNDKRIDRLFIRLAAIYGHLWSNLYKTDEFVQCVKQEWYQGLKAFDNATIGQALERCRENINYPPTLPMFIEVCKSLKYRASHALKGEQGLQRVEDELLEAMTELQHFQKLKNHANPKARTLLDEIIKKTQSKIQKLENEIRFPSNPT